jgi:chemotaxis protein MotB
VAYADFVTAMMSLFIVLWLLNTSKAVREAVAGYFKDPAGTAEKVGSSVAGSGEKILLSHDNMSQLKQKLEKALKQMPNFDKVKKHIVMTITSEGLRIELTESESGTFFDSGSPRLNADGQEIVTVLAGELGKLPNKLALEGHTDSKAYAEGRNYGNWELSADRANSTRRLMQQNGIGADQITQVRGFADQRLLKPDAPLDPANRRISLIVLYQDDNSTTSDAAPSDSSVPPEKDSASPHSDATPPEINGKPVSPTEQKASPPANPAADAKKPSAKQTAPATMSMDEVRRAVEKMNSKTAPASPSAAPDKPKDKPQN